MKRVTVLMTAAGDPSAPGIINCLKNNGERDVRIIGVDMQNDFAVKQMVDKSYIVPRYSDMNYIDNLLDICSQEKVDILIPTMSQELELLLEREEEFNHIGVKLSITHGEGLKIANDKIALYSFMKENGFKVPRFCIIKCADDFERACTSLGYPSQPVCVKMRDGSGSRGIRIIDATKSKFDIFSGEKPNSFFTTMEDMNAILHEVDTIPELMIMEYLPGKEYSVDVLAENGEVRYIVGRESNVIIASIPQEATLAYDKRAYDIVEELTKSLKLDGNLDFDFKYDADGIPQLMEINPRFAATLAVIAAGGINLPYLRVKQLLNEKLPDLSVNYGVRMRRKYLEFYADKDGNEIRIT